MLKFASQVRDVPASQSVHALSRVFARRALFGIVSSRCRLPVISATAIVATTTTAVTVYFVLRCRNLPGTFGMLRIMSATLSNMKALRTTAVLQ